MAPPKNNPSNNPTLLKKIKEEYIYGTIDEEGNTTFESYDTLGKKHEFSISGLKKVGGRESWPALRKDYQTKTELKVLDKKSSVSAAEIVQSDDKFKSTANRIRRCVDDQLNNPKLRSCDLLNLSVALNNAQKIEKVAQGEILEKSKLEIEDKTPKKQNNVFARVDSLMMFIENGNDSNDDRELQSKKPDNS
jgi:hypothetical protein